MRQTFVIIRNFGGVVKPLLSSKVVHNERITLVEDDKIMENDKNTASILNEFFSNIITTVGIPQYDETEPVSHNIGDPLMKAIMNHKKGAKTSKDNYRHVSILSNISQIYERLLYKQISEYFEHILSKFQCGFRMWFWESLPNDLKIKNRLIVLKLPLRDGNLNHTLAVFVKFIYRAQATCRDRGKTK